MSTLIGSLMSAAWATMIPMIARPFSRVRLDRSHRHRLELAVAPDAEHDVVTGMDAGERRPELARGEDRLAARRHDHVALVELGRRRSVGGDRFDERTLVGGLHLEACLLERHGGRDLLGTRHLAQPVLVPGLERRAGGYHLVTRDERRAVRPEEREELLRPGRAADRDVDEVERSGPGRMHLLALDRYLRGDRRRLVGNVEVVVRGAEPGDADERGSHGCSAPEEHGDA